jgi:hypothetical protein
VRTATCPGCHQPRVVVDHHTRGGLLIRQHRLSRQGPRTCPGSGAVVMPQHTTTVVPDPLEPRPS